MSKPPRRAKPDWSQRLPAPIMLGHSKARTLSDVYAFLLALPVERALQNRWQAAVRTVMEAAYGGDIKRVAVAIKFAQMTDPVN